MAYHVWYPERLKINYANLFFQLHVFTIHFFFIVEMLFYAIMSYNRFVQQPVHVFSKFRLLKKCSLTHYTFLDRLRVFVNKCRLYTIIPIRSISPIDYLMLDENEIFCQNLQRRKVLLKQIINYYDIVCTSIEDMSKTTQPKLH